MMQPTNGSTPAAPYPIRYDLGTLRAEFVRMLDDFALWAQTDRIGEAVGPEILKQLREQDRVIRARLAAPFCLVVLGDFKRGKSSLVNALLQTTVATTNVTPETVTINEVTYGSELTLVARLEDGGTVALRPEELAAERLTPLLRRLPQPVHHLEITAPVPWLQGLRLVDTPGTGDMVGRFEGQLAAYLPQADAVIYVVSALAPLSQTEQTFLRLTVLPEDFPKILFVVNMLDVARTDSDAARVLMMVRDKLSEIFPDAPVFGLSALDELSRLNGRRRPNPDRAEALAYAFQAFRDRLQDYVLLNRDLIQLDRSADQVNRVADQIAVRVTQLRQALQTDQQQLGEMITRYESNAATLTAQQVTASEQLQAAINALGAEACGWMDTFLVRLYTEAIARIPQLPPEAVQRHFQFFVADSLRQAMTVCLTAHRSAIEAAAVAASAVFATQINTLTEITLPEPELRGPVAQAAFSQRAWSGPDTVGKALDIGEPGIIALSKQLFKNSDGLAMALDIGGPGITALGGMLLDLFAADIQMNRYQQKLADALPNLRQAVKEQTLQIYQKLAEQIDQSVRSAGQQQLEATVAAMRQAQALAGAGAQRVETANATFAEISEAATQAKTTVTAFQRKLWATTIEQAIVP